MFHLKLITPFHVYLDSPMALEAGKAMMNYPDLFDEEMQAFKQHGLLPLDKKWFHAVATPRESQGLNDIEGPCIILAGAGMCNGGRILHHFRANLWKENTHVMIVGYQGKGSLGRRLVEGAKSVSIYGEKVVVRARVHTLNGFSAHAGQSDLLRWFSAIAESKPRVLLTHGENIPRQALADLILGRFGLRAELPGQGDVIEIVRHEHALARTA
jgi:metallo-beta-lactamase family protein